MTDEQIERGAAEEAADTPVTPTEVAASRRPPSQGDDDDADREDGRDETE